MQTYEPTGPGMMVCESGGAYVLAADARKVEEELETERIRLAGCGVAAMANTEETRSQRIGKDSPYWSASYGDVCAAVDREMALREERDRLRAELERLKNTKCPLLDGVCFDLYEKDASISRLTAELAGMKEALKKSMEIGHNDDCLFCGFKDKFISQALGREAT